MSTPTSDILGRAADLIGPIPPKRRFVEPP